jgi:hypothetical protein
VWVVEGGAVAERGKIRKLDDAAITLSDSEEDLGTEEINSSINSAGSPLEETLTGQYDMLLHEYASVEKARASSLIAALITS